MKLYLLTPTSAVLLGAYSVLSESSESEGSPTAAGFQGIYSAVTDKVAKFAPLSDEQAEGAREKHAYIRKGAGAEEINVHVNDDHSASYFGTSLFSQVCSANVASGNVLLSPLSVYKALALVKGGATEGSETGNELEQVLGPSPSIDQTKDDADVQLVIASSIWADLLRQSFVDCALSEHSAGVFPLPQNYTPINDWIENETNGMIKNLLGDDEIDSNIAALIVSAVYFKGAWTNAFDPNETFDGDFYLRDGSTLPARFMTATREVETTRSSALGDASVILLDYGKKAEDNKEHADFASMFILPATEDADSTNDVIQGLNFQSISQLLEDVRTVTLTLRLPRFRLKFGTESGPESLKSSLQNMGVKEAFNEDVHHKFDEMSNDPDLTVADVLHGAIMEVTEKGTEASAATVVPMRSRSRPRVRYFNRPFVVAIIHRETGTPIFLGRVEEPELLF